MHWLESALLAIMAAVATTTSPGLERLLSHQRSHPCIGQANSTRCLAESQAATVAQISPTDVEQAQQEWSAAIVRVGSRCKPQHGAATRSVCEQAAVELVDTLYGYGLQPTFFKPAMAVHQPWRNTREGVISYLIGGNAAFPEDKGFALEPWTSVRFLNAGTAVQGLAAMVQGRYTFTSRTGKETGLDFSMGYFRDHKGKLRINVHHSSLPFAGNNRTRSLDITVQDVESVQEAWGSAIVDIGISHSQNMDYVQRANTMVNNLYAYGTTAVLFKPMFVKEYLFRLTREGAISYFIGGNKDFPKDAGFALKPWKSVRFHNAALKLESNKAWAMGNYEFTDSAGNVLKAQYTFGYERDSNNHLRVILHHSSVPLSEAPSTSDRRAEDVQASDIIDVQQRWADGIVRIGAEYDIKGNYMVEGAAFVDSVYAYSRRPVLFKPGEAAIQPFRRSRHGAISYFVGGNSLFTEDWGFALKPWRAVEFENVGMLFQGTQGFAVGHYYFITKTGVEHKAEFTMGIVRDRLGDLRINLHHSSFPDHDAAASAVNTISTTPILRNEVLAAQHAFCSSIVKIGDSAGDATKARARATNLVDTLYGYGHRPVLFKILGAGYNSFRLTPEGAQSFFAGGHPEFPMDKGFALRPWAKCELKNADIVVDGNRATAMGNALFTSDNGIKLPVEYSFTYFRDVGGNLRIDQNHLSIHHEPTDTNSTWDNIMSGSKKVVVEMQHFAKGVGNFARGVGAAGVTVGRDAQLAWSWAHKRESWMILGAFMLFALCCTLAIIFCWKPKNQVGPMLPAGRSYTSWSPNAVSRTPQIYNPPLSVSPSFQGTHSVYRPVPASVRQNPSFAYR